MPVQLFTEAERSRRDRFPEVIAYEDLVIFFTLSDRDRQSLPRYSAPHNRLGYALQLCALRFMGFVPDDLSSAPLEAVTFVAEQLGVKSDALADYGTRAQTRQDHLQAVQAHLGYHRANPEDFQALANWLLERALEHDKPTLLYELACEKLRTEQFLRPGVTRLERLVAEARARAQTETYRQLTPLLTEDRKQWLDTLLQIDSTRGLTPLTWLRREANSNSPRAILNNLEKLTFLRDAGIEDWSLAMLNPNRLNFLAHIARKSGAQTLQHASNERRYPVLVAFLYQALAEVIDEVIEMFDRCLAEAYGRAGQDLENFRKAIAQATNEKVHLFRELAHAILDPDIADPNLRSAIYQRITPTVLRRAAAESNRIVRPLDDSYFDFFETRYGYLRQFTPAFLETFTFHSNQSPDPLLEAVEQLQELNTAHRRVVPKEAPTDFVSPKWQPYVVNRDGQIDRHYYELCTLCGSCAVPCARAMSGSPVADAMPIPTPI